MDFKIQGQREISFHGSRIMGAPPREALARFCERNISLKKYLTRAPNHEERELFLKRDQLSETLAEEQFLENLQLHQW